MIAESRQLASLQILLRDVLRGNRFYAEKLSAIDYGTLDEFRASAPFTFKRELIEDQEQNPPFGTNLTYRLERYTRMHQTNGTTGTPLRWLDTPESWAWMLGNWTEVYRAAGVTAADRVYFAFSFGPFLGFWTAFDAAARMGALSIPGGGVHTLGRLHAIVNMGATVLCCTPTYAMRLGEVAREERIDLTRSKVRRVIVAGEPGGSIKATRSRIEEFWPGTRVCDQHGMTEVGPVTYSCPSRDGVLHVIESAYIAEVIDPAGGEPVQPGGKGELVLTTLGRIGSPLIRYRTGDIVERGPDECCECGSADLALVGGILGRTDDMIVVRGMNLYPSAVEGVLRDCQDVGEYRIVIDTARALPELSIDVELIPGSQDPSGVVRRLEAALQNAFALRVRVSVAPPGTLPRFEMKARRWVKLQ